MKEGIKIVKICKPWQDNDGKRCYEMAKGCMTCPLWLMEESIFREEIE